MELQPKDLIISQTNETELKQQAKNKEIKNLMGGIPSGKISLNIVIQLGPNTNIITKDNCPMKRDQIINNMMRFRCILFWNEIDFIPDVLQSYHYFIQFSIFGSKVRYKLDMSMLDMKIITLRKLKVIYFFVNSQESLENYANSGALLKLHLIIESKCNNDKKTIGYLNLPIKDY